MTTSSNRPSLFSRAKGALLVAAAAAGALTGAACEPDKMPFKPTDSRTFAGDVTVNGAELNHGYQSYMRYCYACHGEKGDGKGPASYSLRPPPRDFTKGIFKFGRMRTSDDYPNDEDLIRIVKGGLHGTAMLPWDIPDEELRRILQYIKSFGPVLRCPSTLEGTETAIEDVEGGVAVTVKAADAKSESTVNELRARAKVLVDASKWEDPVALKHCAVITGETALETTDVEGGVKITVKPKEGGDVEHLRREARETLKEAKEHHARDEGIQPYSHSRWEKTKKKKGGAPDERVPYPVLDEWAPEDDPWAGKEEAAIQRGKELYHLKAECVNCHPGFDTKENLYKMSVEANKREPDNFSVLKGFRDDLYHSQLKKSEEYGVSIMPPDFTMDFVRSAHPESRIKDLYRILSFGVYPIMPAWKGAGLTDSDIYALAHYVNSLIELRGKPEALEIKKRMTEQKAFEIPKPEEPKPAEPPAEGEKKEGDQATDKKDDAKPGDKKPEDAKKDEGKKDEGKKEEKK